METRVIIIVKVLAEAHDFVRVECRNVHRFRKFRDKSDVN